MCSLIELMKKSEENKKTKPAISSRWRIRSSNIAGAGHDLPINRFFSKAISFLLVDFSCALKISTPVAYLTAVRRVLNGD